MTRGARGVVLAALACLVGACGDVTLTDRDASSELDAGTPTGPLSLALTEPDFAFADRETCVPIAHDGGAEARVTVTWGDGEVEELAPGALEGCHTWRYPGPVVMGALVEARGMRAEATKLVHVVFEPDAQRPTASSSIAYERGRERVWAVEPDADLVTVIDARTLEVIARVPVGDRPRTVALDGGRFALVACEGDGTVHVLRADDLGSNGVLRFGAGSMPHGVLFDPTGNTAWIALQGTGELVGIDPSGGSPTRISVGRDPRALAMRDDGTIAITRWRSTEESASVVIVDARNASDPRVVGDVLLPREEGRDTDTDNDGVLSFLDALAPSPDGGRVIVPALKANVVAGLFRTGSPLTSQTTARAALAEISLGAPGTLGTDTFRHRFDDLDAASAAVFSPMGERIYMAMRGAEVVIAIDAFSFDTVGSVDDVGHAPDGLVVSPDGSTLFVHAPLSREVRAYDVRDLSRNPTPLARISTIDTEPLAPEVLRGAIVFHASRDPRMSRTRYVSCATCHLDGDADGLTWDFTQRGEGLRNTIPLRGRAGTAHGPMHWSANFDEVQDFEHDIRNGQGGVGFLPDDVFHVGTRDTTLGDPKAGLDEDLDALAAYVSSLASFGTSPTRRADDTAWEASRARGEVIFTSAGCASCHTGPRYTDSAFAAGAPILHDVGTLGPGSGMRLGSGALTGLDTPTLRGLWSSAPYLHDGSAPTLRAVLRDRNPDDRHGTTSSLTEAQLEDLETFLLSLDDSAS